MVGFQNISQTLLLEEAADSGFAAVAWFALQNVLDVI